MRRHPTEATSLRVFEIFQAKRQHVALRRCAGSFEEYRQALEWIREQGCSLEAAVELAEAGERPWRA